MRALGFCLITVFPLLVWGDDSFDIIARVELQPGTVVWSINQPDVTRENVPYPISFKQWDTVTVLAGGCVQTGGSGYTWKRYVEPLGDDTDRLYHGLINIPGITGDFVRISTLVNRTKQVKGLREGMKPEDLILHLSYEDLHDNDDAAYKDNGYYDPDPGNPAQCVGEGNAWVKLIVTPHDGPVADLPSSPMDLYWTLLDYNFLPINPKWDWQLTHPGVPDMASQCNNFDDSGDYLNLGRPACTSQSPSVDEPSFSSNPIYYTTCHLGGGLFSSSVHGHVNWSLASFEGTLYFDDWQGLPFEDDDIDMQLVRNDEAASSVNNHQFAGIHALGLEFAAGETVGSFDTPWWNTFRLAIQAGAITRNWDAVYNLVDGSQAIATGLVGVDTEHDAHVELHPVHALAIQTQSNANEDVWQVFARNWGNEGACSQDVHYFMPPNNKVSFFFAQPADASIYTLDNSKTVLKATFGSPTFGTQNTTIQKGLIVTMQLPAPEQRGTIYGELHIAKTATPTVLPTVTQRLKIERHSFPASEPENHVEEGDSLMALGRYMSSPQQQALAQQQAFQHSLRQAPSPGQVARRDDTVAADVVTRDITPPEGAERINGGTRAFDQVRAAQREQQIQAFSAALGGTTRLETFLNRILADPELQHTPDSLSMVASVTAIQAKDNVVYQTPRWTFDVGLEQHSFARLPLNLSPADLLNTDLLPQAGGSISRQFDLRVGSPFTVSVNAQSNNGAGKGQISVGWQNWILDPSMTADIPVSNGQTTLFTVTVRIQRGKLERPPEPVVLR